MTNRRRPKHLAAGLGAGLKILGTGELTKKLNVTAHAFSASAKAKIEAAGGTCTIISKDSATKDESGTTED